LQRSGTHKATYISIIAGATLLLALGGCATNFDRAYRFAGPEQPRMAVSLTEVPPLSNPPASQILSPAGTELLTNVSRMATDGSLGGERPTAADATGATGSWLAAVYEWLQPWLPDASSPESIMGDLTASAGVWLIRGLSLSPTVQIISIATLVLARPLLREFFEWLGGGDGGVQLADVRPTPVAAPSSEPRPAVTPADERAGATVIVPPERRLSRIGCCDVF